MRITGGQHRGRRLKAPKSGLRPTQDLVREAVFNMLMTRIPDARFLDLYAGSGAIGLEALSRGAADITWVERDRRTLTIIRANVANLAPAATAQTHIVADDALRFLRRTAGRTPCDIIYADPPYTDARRNEPDLLPTLLPLIHTGNLLAREGVCVYESAGGRRATRDEALPEGWKILSDREYGRTRIRLLRPVAKG